MEFFELDGATLSEGANGRLRDGGKHFLQERDAGVHSSGTRDVHQEEDNHAQTLRDAPPTIVRGLADGLGPDTSGVYVVTTDRRLSMRNTC
jgi:hypothetical protein